MNPGLQNPFDSIESAHELVRLLVATVDDAKRPPSRLYNLKKLKLDMNRSRRVLNDLRTLRRLLFDERSGVSAPPTSVKSKEPQPVAAA